MNETILNRIGCKCFSFNLKDCHVSNALAVILGIESNNYIKMHGMPMMKRKRR